MRLINRLPTRGLGLGLALVPLLLLLIVYFTASTHRLSVNPDDKRLPSISQIGSAVQRLAFGPDATGERLLWKDTGASLRRLLLGLALSALIGLVVGIAAGSVPLFAAPVSPLVAGFSMIPPLAMLPILSVAFGLDELSKVLLIAIGVAPMLVRDLERHVRRLPRELIVKAQTLGANTWTTIVRVILPALLPRLLIALRLQLGSAWLLLIAGEAIASGEGLGHRIFLARQEPAMDVILPYVAWITLIAALMNAALRQATRRCFPWFEAGDR